MVSHDDKKDQSPPSAASQSSAPQSENQDPMELEDYEIDEETAQLQRNPAARFSDVSTPDLAVGSANAVEAERKGNYDEAADLWHSEGDFLAELRVLAFTQQYARYGKLLLAFDRSEDAIKSLKKALSQAPADEKLRLLLIQTLIDIGALDEAQRLADVVVSKEGPVLASPSFLADVSRGFESKGAFGIAERYCEIASRLPDSGGRLGPRLTYIQHMRRLASIRDVDQSHFDHNELARALEDTASGFPEEESSQPAAKDAFFEEKPHEIIVGHLALGGWTDRVGYSVRSVCSRARRFEMLRVVGERNSSVVFEGVDNMLDCPVAIRLSRINATREEYEHLRHRLQTVAQINHPNVSKMTFVDRYGPVVRVVHEFHNGGTLVSMVSRLDTIGMPLILRLLLQISASLAAAHRLGIIHGDLRPQNIMIGHDNLIKLTDFALRAWPVRETNLSESSYRWQASSVEAQEVQNDIVQFAEIMEFLLERTISVESEDASTVTRECLEELREVVAKARAGQFSTIKSIQTILHQVLERLIPM